MSRHKGIIMFPIEFDDRYPNRAVITLMSDADTGKEMYFMPVICEEETDEIVYFIRNGLSFTEANDAMICTSGEEAWAYIATTVSEQDGEQE